MTTKYPSPLLGYNNNVRHKGKVFHIQTEDSGVKYGHIITHLFMDGGRILKSVKTSYAEYVGTDRMSEVVREMMKQQHKAMFIALRDGKFDAIIDGNKVTLPKPDPEVFLKGAEAVGVAPAACVVFEDAIAGIEAAKAGGMKAVGIGSPQVLTEADLVVSGLHEMDLEKLEALY